MVIPVAGAHTATKPPARKRRPRGRFVIAAVCFALFVGLIAGGYSVLHQSPPQFMIYDGNVPGQAGATADLEFAHAAGINEVDNYSFINASTQGEDAYLALAQKLHVKVIVSLSDLIGNTPALLVSQSIDQNAADLQAHSRFGQTHAQQIAGIIHRFGNNPAVWGWYITDELPAGPKNPDGVNMWLPALRQIYAEVSSLSHKPILGVFSNNPTGFYKAVDVNPNFQLGADYYCFPDTVPQTYGSCTAIPGIQRAVVHVAGKNAWFIVQGMSWNTEGGHAAWNFPVNSPAPTAYWMASVLENAMANGVHNIGIYMYSDAAQTPGQLARIKIAVAEAKAWWNSQHPFGL